MKNFKLANIEELTLNETIEINGGQVDETSLGYRCGSAFARTFGNIIGGIKLVGDAFTDAVKGKAIDRLLH